MGEPNPKWRRLEHRVLDREDRRDLILEAAQIAKGAGARIIAGTFENLLAIVNVLLCHGGADIVDRRSRDKESNVPGCGVNCDGSAG
jgi:hypothetical protein